jgi:hypothetical protein
MLGTDVKNIVAQTKASKAPLWLLLGASLCSIVIACYLSHRALFGDTPHESSRVDSFTALKLQFGNFLSEERELSLEQMKLLKSQLIVFGLADHFNIESKQRFREGEDLEKWRRVRSLVTNNDRLIIDVDALSHEIVYILYPQSNKGGKRSNSKIQFSDTDAINASMKLANIVLPDWIGAEQQPTVSRRLSTDSASMSRYVVVWPIKYHGYSSWDFHCSFIWYFDGTFSGFCLSAPPTPPEPVVNVNAIDAKSKSLEKEIWSNLGPKYKVSDPQLADKEPELLWVGPRPLLEFPAHEYHRILSKLPRLAWVVDMHVVKRGEKKKAQIWIDCEDGEFLGGYLP